jgi:hypothetical protein
MNLRFAGRVQCPSAKAPVSIRGAAFPHAPGLRNEEARKENGCEGRNRGATEMRDSSQPLHSTAPNETLFAISQLKIDHAVPARNADSKGLAAANS